MSKTGSRSTRRGGLLFQVDRLSFFLFEPIKTNNPNETKPYSDQNKPNHSALTNPIRPYLYVQIGRLKIPAFRSRHSNLNLSTKAASRATVRTDEARN